MAHTVRDKSKLVHRISRIKGQLDAIQRALENEEECSRVLLTLAASRGAINALMAEVIEGHIRFHVVDPDRNPSSDRARATQQLIDVVKAYLK